MKKINTYSLIDKCNFTQIPQKNIENVNLFNLYKCVSRKLNLNAKIKILCDFDFDVLFFELTEIL